MDQLTPQQLDEALQEYVSYITKLHHKDKNATYLYYRLFKAFEKAVIKTVYELENKNKTTTCLTLGVSRTLLFDRVRRYELGEIAAYKKRGLNKKNGTKTNSKRKLATSQAKKHKRTAKAKTSTSTKGQP